MRLPVRPMQTPGIGSRTEAWQAYRAELVRFALGRVGDAAVADDLVHDVLLKALTQMQALEDPGKLRAWLYRITRNVIVDHYRTRRPAEPLPEDWAAEDAGAVERAEQDLARCLTPLLAELPAPYRRALTLAELEGVPQREIARREGLSFSGAKSRVQRARGMLREALLACCRVELDRRGAVVDYAGPERCAPCDGAADCGDGGAGEVA